MARRALVFTEQLHKDLARIHEFIGDENFDAFVPSLKRAVSKLTSRPGLGRPFQHHQASPRVRAMALHIGQRLGTDDLRELVLVEHTVLYAVTTTKIFILSIRNQLESGFQLG
ncbi:MAG: type II toxin-antitoxin system RelE/ParE family toxin [Archangium sp.]